MNLQLEVLVLIQNINAQDLDDNAMPRNHQRIFDGGKSYLNALV